jgi:hypothetical protein
VQRLRLNFYWKIARFRNVNNNNTTFKVALQSTKRIDALPCIAHTVPCLMHQMHISKNHVFFSDAQTKMFENLKSCLDCEEPKTTKKQRVVK